MSTPTKQELQDLIRDAILNKDRTRAVTLWQAYQNKEYTLEPTAPPIEVEGAALNAWLFDTLTAAITDGNAGNVDFTAEEDD